MRLVPAALLLVVAAAGCQRGPPADRPLRVASDAEAAALLDRFFAAYVDRHVDTALTFLCEKDVESQSAARRFIEESQREGSAFRVTRHEVRRVEPKWLGAEPYFYVEVAFPRTSGPGEVVHGYHVRVREGCIESFLGRAAAPPHAAPSTSPAAPKPAAPAEPASPEGAIEL